MNVRWNGATSCAAPQAYSQIAAQPQSPRRRAASLFRICAILPAGNPVILTGWSSRRLLRWTLAAVVSLAGIWAPRAAAAAEFYADLDYDGVRDVVSIQTVPRTGLRVWLSKSNSTLILRTRRVITHIAASDIDGDGRIDLVASDSAARVTVWHRTNRGHLRVTHPRRVTRPDTMSRSRRVHGAGDEAPVAALDDSGPTAPFGGRDTHGTPLAFLDEILPPTPAPGSAINAQPRASRGPPFR